MKSELMPPSLSQVRAQPPDLTWQFCVLLWLVVSAQEQRIRRLEEFNRQLAEKVDEQRRALDAAATLPATLPQPAGAEAL